MKFTFGSDPEFPIVTTNGKFKSAVGVLPSKKKAKKTKSPFYFDNVMAEAQMKPATTKIELLINVKEMLDTLAEAVHPHKILLQSAVNYPKNELKTKEALEAGCVPEINVYTLKQMPLPNGVALNEENERCFLPDVTMRTAGGHIHLGTNEKNGPLFDPIGITYIVKMLDLFLGIPSLFIDKDSTSQERRKMYGLAGTHRTPEYGVEYRPLGNFWFGSPKLVNLIYDICNFVLDFVEKEGHLRFWAIDESKLGKNPEKAHICHGYDVKQLQNCINNCDKQKAEKFMSIVCSFMPTDLYCQIEQAIENPEPDIYEEWNL